MPPLKILVTGANGFIGSKLIEKISKSPNFKVIGLSIGDNRVLYTDFKYYSVDLRNRHEVENCFNETQPDVVVHTAAISQVDVCEVSPDLCNEVNVIATETLASQCRKHNARLIFLSSDFVFDGIEKWVTDETLPNPISKYGEGKLKAELVVAKLSSWAIIRPVLVYGFSKSASRGNIFTWVVDSIKSRKKINVVNDQLRTPTFVNDVVCLIEHLILYPKNGYFNLGGSERVSVFEFAIRIVKLLNLNTHDIKSVPSKSIQNAVLRPQNSCFENVKIKKEFDLKPRGVDDGIEAALTQMKYPNN